MKKKLLIDMDGVLIQSAKACMELYQRDKGIYIDWNIRELQWDFKPYVPDEDFKTVISYFNDQRMYDIAEPLKDSVEALKRLSEYYELVVVTKAHRYALPYKANWLYNYFSFVDRVIYLDQKDFDKSLIAGDYIIDDKIQPLCGGNRETAILFGNYYYNNFDNITDFEQELIDKELMSGNPITKIYNWLDIEEYLMTQVTK
jgi:5'(3')-deoxyribonucleotidase